MESYERKRIEELKAHVKCAKNFACIESALDGLCKAQYHKDIDVLECLQATPLHCKFARPFSSTFVCLCPLRIYIAKHFDKWTAGSTAAMRNNSDNPD